MKVVTDKFLCFMWGHVFETIVGVVTITYGGSKFESLVEIKKCKFCGERGL